VHADPGSLAAKASLSLSPLLLALFDDEQLSGAELDKRLKKERFRLSVFDATDGAWDEKG